MTLLDEARVAQLRVGPECAVSATRRTLDGGLVQEFDELIGDAAVFATTAARILKAHNIPVPSESIQRHRSRRCKCDVAA